MLVGMTYTAESITRTHFLNYLHSRAHYQDNQCLSGLETNMWTPVPHTQQETEAPQQDSSQPLLHQTLQHQKLLQPIHTAQMRPRSQH